MLLLLILNVFFFGCNEDVFLLCVRFIMIEAGVFVEDAAAGAFFRGVAGGVGSCAIAARVSPPVETAETSMTRISKHVIDSKSDSDQVLPGIDSVRSLAFASSARNFCHPL